MIEVIRISLLTAGVSLGAGFEVDHELRKSGVGSGCLCGTYERRGSQVYRVGCANAFSGTCDAYASLCDFLGDFLRRR